MHELIRNYCRDHGHPRCAIKVDLMKAYDSVDWDFLIDTMTAMEFLDKFVNWIKACITSPMFSIKISGGLEWYFPGARGLRRGDPISPYLFLQVMEAFSSLLAKNIESGGFQYHPKCQALEISHVVFADDLFILSSAHSDSLKCILQTLKNFHSFSGLQPNMLKSTIFLVGLSSSDKQIFTRLMAISEGTLPVKYLGVPLITTRLTLADYSVLKDKILSRIYS